MPSERTGATGTTSDYVQCRPGYVFRFTAGTAAAPAAGSGVTALGCVNKAGLAGWAVVAADNCGMHAIETATPLNHCMTCPLGYGFNSATGLTQADTQALAAGNELKCTINTNAAVLATGNCEEHVSGTGGTTTDECITCSPKWVLVNTTGTLATTCTAGPTGNDNCARTNAAGTCIKCRNGYFFNGNTCVNTAVLPSPSGRDMCMRTNSASVCMTCFNDPNTTEGARGLSAARGNCQTAMAAADKVTGAVYYNGERLATDTAAYTGDEVFCPEGEAFHFDSASTTFAKNCAKLASGDITNCMYQSHNKTGSKVECQMCKAGFKGAGTGNKASCTAIDATDNCSLYRGASCHQCKAGYIKDNAGSCIVWAAATKSNDQNCNQVNAANQCIECKWGYYFGGAWCVKGASTGTTTATTTTTGTTTTTTTTAKAGFLNIFAVCLALAVSAFVN